MRNLFACIFLLPMLAWAQSSLPPCPASGWKHNCFGEATSPDGQRYVGEFRNDGFDGQGTWAHPNGARYVGEFRDNAFHGQGTFTTPGGDRYVGGFRNDLRHGRGSFFWASGAAYSGDFVEGRREGFGNYKFNNGNRYTGGFRNDAFQGQGIQYRASGTVLRGGVWEGEKLLEALALSTESYPFDPVAALRASLTTALNAPALTGLSWRDRLERAVQAELRRWLTPDAQGLAEVAAPTFPAALSLKQESWESNKEFEARVEAARTERRQTIDRLQAEYRKAAEERNVRVAQYNRARAEREAGLAGYRRELVLNAIEILPPTPALSAAAFDQQSGALTLAAQVEGLGKQTFAFVDAPQAFRRSALTALQSLRATTEFRISDAGDIVLEAIAVEAGGTTVRGTPAAGVTAPVQLAAVTLPATSTTAVAAQSTVSVDRNQVEQILYREENEMLRRRLEEQRKQQELAVAAEQSRAAAEIARLRTEAEELRKQPVQVRPAISVAAINDAHALIIGNSAYAGSNRLANPGNDARAMRA
ncbi:MAG: hypothetical protein ACKO3C_05405, partial [Betaproteobacteria bacterium]